MNLPLTAQPLASGEWLRDQVLHMLKLRYLDGDGDFHL